MDTDKIIAKLAENPGSTAQELGVTPVEMTRLFHQKKVIKVGTRSTGTRGRPPVEWAVPGADVQVDERVNIGQEAARKRVEDSREWMRSHCHVWHIREAYGADSEQARAAYLDHKEKWPTPPESPRKGDYAAIGEAFVVPEGVSA